MIAAVHHGAESKVATKLCPWLSVMKLISIVEPISLQSQPNVMILFFTDVSLVVMNTRHIYENL